MELFFFFISSFDLKYKLSYFNEFLFNFDVDILLL